MRILAASFVLAMLSTMLACPAHTPVAPVTDASDGAVHDGVVVTVGSCAQACQRLRDIKCSDGYQNDAGDSCEEVCDHAQNSGLFDMKPSCLAAAQTLEAARACGTVSCK